ncbi:Na/Pi cotransporter family protein [Methylobacterium sp. A54F]
MTGTILLLDLAGWVALLLWGIHMIRTGVQRAYGGDLRRVLGASLGHPLRAFAAGLGVTMLLQSSTATGLMATSFAASGFVELVPALAVMLGANVGTALIVKVLSFDVAKAAPVLVLVGTLAFGRATGGRGRALGRVAIGLGLVVLALVQLVATLEPLGTAPELRALLTLVSADPVVAALIGAAIAWLAHSSVAVVLLVAAFAAQGVVPGATALALVLGANLGSALNPLIASRDPAGRRVALGNLLVRLAGCALALPLLGPIEAGLDRLGPDPRVRVADFHLLFNLCLALAGLPLLRPLAALLRRLLPEGEAAEALPRLDASLAEVPSIALGHASRRALRMADILEGMLADGSRLLRAGEGVTPRIRLGERTLEDLGTELQRFLAGLDTEALGEDEARRLSALVAFTIQIGHAGDILAGSVAGQIGRRRKLGAGAGEDALDLAGLLQRLSINLRTAASLLVTEDGAAARRLAAEKRAFRDLEERRIDEHVARLRAGSPQAAALRAVELDLLRDCKRINDHLVAAAAYPILRQSGDLLDSRLRSAAAPRLSVDGPQPKL